MGLSSVSQSVTGIRSANEPSDIAVANEKAIDRSHRRPAEMARQRNEINLTEMLMQDEAVDMGLPLPVPRSDQRAAIGAAHNTLSSLEVEQARADLYAILDLVLRVTQAQRKDLHQIRASGQQNQLAIQRAAADKIRESADLRMWGSITSGAFQIVGGSAMALGGGEASNRIFGSIGTMSDAGFGTFAAEHDAERVELDAGARKQEQATQVINESMQQLLDGIRNLLDKLQSIEQQRLDTNRGISRNL